ncbi:Eco57I restriction-modification methylase domain-containing protein [Faecalicatena sp. AGMB00832]|uniref:site-specific DNA-methyltransferase (adenine-specific) n=1 Tax=Faecalicatena faecalis TaxID=2726362 RepID=A0ABS6DAH0_9FIRM|nr:DNA methyltransferase [Faecalicatena faecalis]MBU3878630.1 Eco57I restriction-modification methylase domain-containing protein [Faecalicatena faecalis]
MGKERLEKLVSKYRKSIAYYHDSKNAYNEQNCRDEYISPFLECLGWDVQNTKGTLPQYQEVVSERYSNSAERPDYTLTLNGVSRLFVEAKKPGVDITVDAEPAMQTRRYGWNAKHRLSVLTNFEYLLIYDTTNKPEAGEGASASLFRKYHYEEYVEHFEEIYDLISRESVYSGRYDEYVEQQFPGAQKYQTEIDGTFLNQINDWRLELGRYLYAVDERYQDLDRLNDEVQAFINQIIFLRICEDRNLPLYRSLKDAAKDKEELKRVLNQMFKEADKRYDSGLFREENPLFDLENDMIFDMVMSLYYPKTPYLFHIIEPGILGKIYESFLTERIVYADGEIRLAQKFEYIYKSVVSTPQEVVKYMVKNTLDKVCIGKTPGGIRKLKIVDPSCGSGIFLEEAYQYLVDYCTQWYAVNRPEYLLELGNGRKKLPIEEKRELLVHCIYGVDIDIHAVEVAKFSLVLKLLEDETEPSVKVVNPILPNLDANIHHGNALVSRTALSELDPTVQELVDIVPFDWDEINGGEKFDVILGNPPYVKTEDIKKLHTRKEQKLYNQYQSAYRQYDKYFLFMEKALELIKESGYICYIVPNKWIRVESGERLRGLLAEQILEIDDFGSKQLFAERTIYSSIVTIAGEKSERLSCHEVKDLVSLWTKGRTDAVSIPKQQLNSQPWKPAGEASVTEPWFITGNQEYYDILEGIKGKTESITEHIDIFNGIQTSAEKIYRIDGKEIVAEDSQYVTFVKNGKEYTAEKAVLRPYFKPNRLEKEALSSYSNMKLLTKTYNIFPYDRQGNLIGIKEMETSYPKVWAYLLEHKEALLPKYLGGKRDVQPRMGAEQWYCYGRRQAITSLNERVKIIVGVNRKKDNPLYLLDHDNMLIATGGTAGYAAISSKEGSPYALEYIQAWLGHPLTDLYLQIIGSDFEGEFIARGTYTLPMVPFVKLDFGQEEQRKLYENVVTSSQKIYEINKQLEVSGNKAVCSVLEKEKKKLIADIEDDITRIYQQKF